MFRLTLVLLIAFAVLTVNVVAQPKVISLSEGNREAPTLTFYPAPGLLQPTVAAAIILAPYQSPSTAGLAAALNKKGMPVFVANKFKGALTTADVQRAFQYLHSQVAALQLSSVKTGLITLGENAGLATGATDAAFVAVINPMAKPGNIPAGTPVLLSLNGNDDKNSISFYTRLASEGREAELNLHNRAVADSIQYQEVISWLDGLGLLKPISNERTAERKKADDWTAFTKVIEERLHNDWPWIKRYEADNEKLLPPAPNEKRIVFMGNSITEGWLANDPEFFKSHGYVNRGIGGQTTPQMLLRFREDVVNLHPKLVVILAGINDIAQNTGPNKLENVAGNIISMAEIAHANGIKVVLCTVLPALAFPWHPGINPVNSIISLNTMLREYAQKNKLGYINYYSALIDEQKGFKKELTVDGVHPNLAGYKIMEPLAEAAINRALTQP